MDIALNYLISKTTNITLPVPLKSGGVYVGDMVTVDCASIAIEIAYLTGKLESLTELVDYKERSQIEDRIKELQFL